MFDRGILGINRRNAVYIKEFNPKKGIRLANNKLQTKKFLSKRGIPVPQTLAFIRHRADWLSFDFSDINQDTFVIKPNKGSKGKGILVVKDKRKGIATKKATTRIDRLRGNSRIIDHGYEFLIEDKRIPEYDLKKKVVGIFDGAYSNTQKSDTVLIEERLFPGGGFEAFCEHGLADMRIIMFNLVPIIAMLRMPTKQSGGKANLAQGGIGLGLDVVTGKVTSLYRQDKSYTETFPEQRSHLKGKKIPYWQHMLEYSSNAQYLVNIGYLGMDRVLTSKGPKLLEINARSGLEIQNITGKPLLSIMKKIEDLDISTPQKGIEICKSLFSQERITQLKEDQLLYLSQLGKLTYIRANKKKYIPIKITINLKKNKNYTSPHIIRTLQGTRDCSIFVSHNHLSIQHISLQEDKTILGNHIVLGRQTLQHYFVKPTHKSYVNTTIFCPGTIVEDEIVELKQLDEELHSINKYLNLSRILRPTNYLDELDRFASRNGHYNPHFVYRFPKYKDLHSRSDSISELERKHFKKSSFDSPFAQIFLHKIREMQTKILLIKAYKKQDFILIDQCNKQLYGDINPELLMRSKQLLIQHKKPRRLMGHYLKGKDLQLYIQDYIDKKGLTKDVKIIIKKSYGTGLSVGFGNRATIKIDIQSSYREYELLSQLSHEVDVHIKRYLQGKKNGRHVLTTGTAGYLSIEEGLAVLLANKKTQEIIPDYDSLAKYKNYYRASLAKELSFADLAQQINLTYNKKGTIKNYKQLFDRTLKFVKGKKDTSLVTHTIVYGRGLVYLNGYDTIMKAQAQNPMIIKSLLKYGKIGINDLIYFQQ